MSIDRPSSPRLDAEASSPLATGTAVGPYRIVDLIGRGGMGEVYRATDTRLHRDVAVKVLAQTAAAVADVDRFLQEARVTASLDHSNIVKVYDVGVEGERPYLIEELLHGETLRARLSRGPLPVAEAVRVAHEIAQGLAAAHAAGLVHRDLKPENVFLTRSGVAKLLDFGIAKLTHDVPGGLQTTTGVLVGTPGYLAPEQIRGVPVDARTDLFAVGLVAHEMLTGRHVFARGTPVETMHAILNDPAPDTLDVRGDVPADLGAIVSRLLQKTPEARFQSAADLAWALERVDPQRASAGRRAGGEPAERVRRWREPVAWIVAAAALAVAAAVAFRQAPPPASIDLLSMLPPPGTTLAEGEAPQISPDGRTIAFVATDPTGRTLLYLRERGSLEVRALPETDDAAQPFWSPDSTSMGFFASGMLKTVALSGGRPRPLANAPVPRGGAWSPTNEILFVPFPEQPLQSIPAGGGTPAAVPADPAGGFRWFPSMLPDGVHYVFLGFSLDRGEMGLHVGSLAARASKSLVPDGTQAMFVAPDVLLFGSKGSLLAQPFSVDRLEMLGTPVPLVDDLGANPITTQASFSASPGALAYVAAGQQWQLEWFDPAGRRVGEAGSIGGHNGLCLAADGRRIIYDAADPRTGSVDLWSLDATDGTTSRLTFHDASDFYPACSPSTAEVIFSSPRGAPPTPYRLDLAAPGSEQVLGSPSRPILPTQWSRDGRHLVYSAFSPETSWDVWVRPLAGGEAIPYAATKAQERNGQLSPDGRWMAYASDQDGVFQVYVQPFPATGARWQISQNGGRQPLWSPDGRGLYYISLDKKLVRVDADPRGSRFERGASRVVMDTRTGAWERTHQGTPYAISADGSRILVANAQAATVPITLVLNWRQRLAR